MKLRSYAPLFSISNGLFLQYSNRICLGGKNPVGFMVNDLGNDLLKRLILYWILKMIIYT